MATRLGLWLNTGVDELWRQFTGKPPKTPYEAARRIARVDGELSESRFYTRNELSSQSHPPQRNQQ